MEFVAWFPSKRCMLAILMVRNLCVTCMPVCVRVCTYIHMHSCVCMCVCLHVHACVYFCVHVFVCMYIQIPEVNVKCFITLFSFFWVRVSPWTWGLLFWLDWLANTVPFPRCTPLRTTLTWGLGTQTQGSVLAQRGFPTMAISQPLTRKCFNQIIAQNGLVCGAEFRHWHPQRPAHVQLCCPCLIPGSFERQLLAQSLGLV